MKPTLWALAVVLCALGCGGNTDEETMPTSLTPPTAAQEKAAAEMKTSRDSFAFTLKDRLLKEHPKENVCYSPLSVQLCLSMLLNGAAGDSADQMRKTLSLDKESTELANDGNYALLAALSGDSFTYANSIWLPTQLPPKQEFLTTINDSYRGAFFGVKDFGPDTVQRINDWTSDNTKKRIPKLFDELDKDTSVVLVNALAFDGKWSHPFDKEATKPQAFKLLNGQSLDVPTMHQKRHLAFAEYNGATFLRMNYKGDAFSMVLMLPPGKVDASAYLAKLTAGDFRKAVSSLGDREIDVALPKFELKSSYSLKETLSAMGMARLFEHANLANIADTLKDGTRISQVVHQTYMKVYEEGTEAAAATGVVGVTSAIPGEPATFHADRPFVYALVHNSTGAVVFLGVVTDPRG
jgi:serpin B